MSHAGRLQQLGAYSTSFCGRPLVRQQNIMTVPCFGRESPLRVGSLSQPVITANGCRHSDNHLSLWTGWVALANEQLQRQTGIAQLVLVLPSQTPSGNVWGGNGECKGRGPIKAFLAGHAKEPPSSSPSIPALCFGQGRLPSPSRKGCILNLSSRLGFVADVESC